MMRWHLLLLALLLPPAARGFNYFVKKEKEPYGICVSDESDAIGPIWDLSANKSEVHPNETANWVEEWQMKGFNTSTSQDSLRWNFHRDWEKLPLVFVREEYKKLASVRSTNKWGAFLFSMQTASTTTSILLSEGKDEWQGKPGFLLQLQMNTSQLVVKKCDIADEESNCTTQRTTDLNKFVTEKEHHQNQWHHFILELDDMSLPNVTYIKFDTFTAFSKFPLTNLKARNSTVKNIFVKSADGLAVFKVHKESIVMLVEGADRSMTRNLDLEKNSNVSVLVKWLEVFPDVDNLLRLDVRRRNETNETVLTKSFEMTKSFSHVEIALSPGEYQLSISNFCEGIIERVNVNTKEVYILEEEENVKGCQFFKDDYLAGLEEVVVNDDNDVATCRNEVYMSGDDLKTICSALNGNYTNSCTRINFCDQMGCFVYSGTSDDLSSDSVLISTVGCKKAETEPLVRNKWVVVITIIPMLLLLIAACIAWRFRKRSVHAKETKELHPQQPACENKPAKDVVKIFDGDMVCEAEYCEMENVENTAVEVENNYENAHEEKPINAQMKLAEVENDYTSII